MQNRKTRLVLQIDEVWEFYRDADGWRWRHVDGNGSICSSATRSFGHLLECAANARTNGYRPNSPSRFVSAPV
jgi:hypothetical protein